MSRAHVLLIALLVAPLAACDNGPLPTTTDTTTTTTTVTSPVTETFASQLFVGGYAFRSFTAAKAGTSTVTLTTVGSSTTQKLGMGVGIPDASGSGCLFTRSIETAAGGQISANVDPGVYCVRVWDLGTLTQTTTFTVTIVRP
jgi:hypothetical protein